MRKVTLSLTTSQWAMLVASVETVGSYPGYSDYAELGAYLAREVQIQVAVDALGEGTD